MDRERGMSMREKKKRGGGGKRVLGWRWDATIGTLELQGTQRQVRILNNPFLKQLELKASLPPPPSINQSMCWK